MVAANYLQRTKNGWFRYRRALPADIRKQYKKPVYLVALGTCDAEEAKRLAHAVSVEFDKMVARMRAAIDTRSKGLLRSCDIDAVSKRFEALLLHSDEAQRKHIRGNREEMATHKALVLEGAAQTAAAAYDVDASDYVEDYTDFLQTEGLRIHPGWGHFERFVLSMLDAQHRAYIALADRINGANVPTPPIPASASRRGDDDNIEKIVARWKAKQGIGKKTGIEIDSCVRRLFEFSKVRYVSDIGATLPAEFRDYLLAYGNVNRVKPGERGTPLEVATVKKLIRLLSAAIQSAVDDNFIPKNPLVGLKFPRGQGATKIQRFDVDQLNRIFSSPVYTENYRPVGGAGEAAFWLPLFGLFCGGRETELGQLLVKDFGVENGHYFFAVTDTGIRDDGTEQEVKNEESLRRIPLHPQLIKMGLLDYVAWLKARGENRLFPDLKPDRLGWLMGNWSKWFNRYLDDIVGIDERSWNYHSLRHTLKYYGRASHVPAELLDRLQGHTPENVGGAYGGEYPIGPLADAMAMIHMPGLNLDGIYWHAPVGKPLTRLPRHPGPH